MRRRRRRIEYPDELYHFGIKGMKWGVRKDRKAVKLRPSKRSKEDFDSWYNRTFDSDGNPIRPYWNDPGSRAGVQPLWYLSKNGRKWRKDQRNKIKEKQEDSQLLDVERKYKHLGAYGGKAIRNPDGSISIAYKTYEDHLRDKRKERRRKRAAKKKEY